MKTSTSSCKLYAYAYAHNITGKKTSDTKQGTYLSTRRLQYPRLPHARPQPLRQPRTQIHARPRRPLPPRHAPREQERGAQQHAALQGLDAQAIGADARHLQLRRQPCVQRRPVLGPQVRQLDAGDLAAPHPVAAHLVHAGAVGDEAAGPRGGGQEPVAERERRFLPRVAGRGERPRTWDCFGGRGHGRARAGGVRLGVGRVGASLGPGPGPREVQAGFDQEGQPDTESGIEEAERKGREHGGVGNRARAAEQGEEGAGLHTKGRAPGAAAADLKGESIHSLRGEEKEGSGGYGRAREGQRRVLDGCEERGRPRREQGRRREQSVGGGGGEVCEGIGEGGRAGSAEGESDPVPMPRERAQAVKQRQGEEEAQGEDGGAVQAIMQEA